MNKKRFDRQNLADINRDNRKRLIWSFILLITVLFMGTVGYLILTGQTLWKCFYMTVITITTVGYSDILNVHKETGTAIFTVLLLFMGLGVLLYTVSTATAFVVEGDLTEVLRRHKMEKRIAAMNEHYIVCGAGETGVWAAQELLKTGRQIVVIDTDQTGIVRLNREYAETPYLLADASDDDILLAAGITRAAGLITSLPDDKDNVFVVLSARRLASSLRIVARAIEKRTILKLKTAGADAVVTPNQIGGMRMASELVRPCTVSFLDTMLRGEDSAVRFEDIIIPAGSGLIGKTLAETGINREGRSMIVGLRAPGQPRFTYAPSTDTVMEEGMSLVLLGRSRNIIKIYRQYQLQPPGRDHDTSSG